MHLREVAAQSSGRKVEVLLHNIIIVKNCIMIW